MTRKNNEWSGLYCEEYGEGEPVIFIHGFGANLFSWRHLKPLSSRYRVILIDLKGFGRSQKPFDRNYSIYDQADLIHRFIKEHDLNNLTIAGNSLGGGVSLILALYLIEKDPGLLKRLILIDSVGYEQKLPLFIRILRVPLLGRVVMAVVPDRLLALVVLRQAYHDDEKITSESIEKYAEPLSSPGADHAIIQTARQVIPADIRKFTDRYPAINVPTLIIWGREDEIIPLSIGERLHRDIKNSRLVVFDRCGHIPQEEEPEKTLKAIEDFLAGC